MVANQCILLDRSFTNTAGGNGSYFEYRSSLEEYVILCKCSIARIAGLSKRTSVVCGFGNYYHTYFGRIHIGIYIRWKLYTNFLYVFETFKSRTTIRYSNEVTMCM